MSSALAILSAWKALLTTIGIPPFTSSLLKCPFLRGVLLDHHLSHSFSPYPISFSSECCFFFYFWCLFIICLSHAVRASEAQGLVCCALPISPTFWILLGTAEVSKLFKEICLTPKDTKNLSSTFPRQFQSPVSPRKQRNGKRLLLGVHPDCVRAAHCPPSAGVLDEEAPRPHTSLHSSLWIPGTRGPTMFPFLAWNSCHQHLLQRHLRSAL